MSRSRVFAVRQPTGRDHRNGHIRPTMDLTPAAEYGELHFILRDWQNPFNNLDAVAAQVRAYLVTEAFGPDDWLLLVGNPILIGVVAAVAGSLVGELRMLQWSRTDGQYRPVEVQLPAVA